MPGRVAQSVVRLTHEAEIPGSIPGPATYFLFSFLIQEGQLSVTGEYVHLILVNCLECPSLFRNSVVRSSDRLDMTIAVHHGL